MPSKFRAWTFTLNNHTFEELLHLIESDYSYLCFGFETAPKTGTPHLQGFIYLHSQKTLSSISKKYPRYHFEPSRGTVKQNKVYTEKLSTGDWYEFGEAPQQGRLKWDIIEEVMKDPTSDPHLYNQYHKMYRQIQNSKKKDHTRVLIMCHHDYKYQLLSKFASVCFNEDVYDSEECICLHGYDQEHIMDWINGFPHKVKRGYEIINVDPQYYVLIYLDAKQCNYHLKNLSDYIDIVISSEDTLKDYLS